MTRAYLIDPEARTVTEVEHDGTAEDIRAKIGAQHFEAVMLHNCADAPYIDEEARLGTEKKDGFCLEHGQEPILGRGLIVGNDGNGDAVDAYCSIAELRGSIIWVTRLLVGNENVFIAKHTGAVYSTERRIDI